MPRTKIERTAHEIAAAAAAKHREAVARIRLAAERLIPRLPDAEAAEARDTVARMDRREISEAKTVRLMHGMALAYHLADPFAPPPELRIRSDDERAAERAAVALEVLHRRTDDAQLAQERGDFKETADGRDPRAIIRAARRLATALAVSDAAVDLRAILTLIVHDPKASGADKDAKTRLRSATIEIAQAVASALQRARYNDFSAGDLARAELLGEILVCLLDPCREF